MSMQPLVKKFRTMATEQATASMQLKGSDDFATNPMTQSLFIVGQVAAKMYHALADVVEAMSAQEQQDPMAWRRAIIERNQAIREAAANASITQDWSKFDQLVREQEQRGLV